MRRDGVPPPGAALSCGIQTETVRPLALRRATRSSGISNSVSPDWPHIGSAGLSISSRSTFQGWQAPAAPFGRDTPRAKFCDLQVPFGAARSGRVAAGAGDSLAALNATSASRMKVEEKTPSQPTKRSWLLARSHLQRCLHRLSQIDQYSQDFLCRLRCESVTLALQQLHDRPL